MIISYGSKHRTKVLDSFGLKAKDGLIVDKKTEIPVADNLGGALSAKRFGGIRKGSFEYINKDIPSLIKLSKKLQK
jgi:hypothetical protein